MRESCLEVSSTFYFSFDYINDVAGHRTVPVEIGSSYADSGYMQRLMKIREYLAEFIEKNGTIFLEYK